MRPDETSAVHVSRNNTMIVCVSNRVDGLHVGPRQCGGAQASLRAKRVIARSKSQSNLRV